jgi:hypothetical protein
MATIFGTDNDQHLYDGDEDDSIGGGNDVLDSGPGRYQMSSVLLTSDDRFYYSTI